MKRIRVAELKARLSEVLRLVRKGGTVTVCDRDTPIARLVPYHEEDTDPPLRITPAEVPFSEFWKVPIPEPPRIDIDIVQLLLEDRESGR